MNRLNETTKPKRFYYTVLEVADRLQVTRESLYKWIYSGRLPASNATGHWRVSSRDLQQFMRAGMNTNRIKQRGYNMKHDITTDETNKRGCD